MSPSFKTLASKAKAHHESLNAAYATYYGGGVSPSPSPSRSSSTETSTEPERSSSMSKAWEKVKKAAKEHHEGVNAAYATYYGAGASPAPSAAASSRSSLESVRGEQDAKEDSVARKSWDSFKKTAKEHHKSVNAAYATYYSAH